MIQKKNLQCAPNVSILVLYITDNHIYTDTRYNDKVRYNVNLNVTKPSL